MPKNVSVTIGIPTYEAGQSLVATVNSIMSQTAISSINEILVVVDGHDMSREIRQAISYPKVKVIIKRQRQGQAARINDLAKMAKSDVLILTNDDVLLDRKAVAAFIQSFADINVDVLTSKAFPLPATSLLESVLEVGYDLTHNLIKRLPKVNYLSCNGRLVCLSRRFYQNLDIPTTIWNNDAYLFFFAILNGYTYQHLPAAKVYFQSPRTLDEHEKQSRKFQASLTENQAFFDQDLAPYYQIPKPLLLRALVRSFIDKPLRTAAYMILSVKARFNRPSTPNHRTGYWTSDKSTKVLTSGIKS